MFLSKRMTEILNKIKKHPLSLSLIYGVCEGWLWGNVNTCWSNLAYSLNALYVNSTDKIHKYKNVWQL